MNAKRLFALPAVLLAIVLSGSLLTACSGESGDGTDNSSGEATAKEGGADDKQDEATPVPVEVAVATRGDIFAAYSGSAPIEAFEEAVVVAKVQGEVRELLVEEGDIVKAGQPLARLDGDRLRLRMEQAAANLAKVERDYKRNLDLHEKGLVSSGAFENLKFEVDALRAEYRIARLEHQYATIVAPIDGVVSERMIKVGNTIDVNAPCFHIAALQPLVAYLHVPEREFGKIAADQPVEISVDALGDEVFQARVARISPVVDASTGTFKATVEIDLADTTLRPGMFARASIIYESRPDALLVPRAALTETEVGDSVYVVNGDKVERRSVSIGYNWRDQMEITDGVTTGDTVVVVGQAGLRDGARVEVIVDEPDQSSNVADSGDIENASTDDELADAQQSAVQL